MVCDVWCKASVMSMVAPLYRELLAVCSNGCIPNLKFTSALKACHATKKIYHNSEDIKVWAPSAGGKLRMIAQKWRTMAEDQDAFDRCLKKACHRTYRVLGFKAWVVSLGL